MGVGNKDVGGGGSHLQFSNPSLQPVEAATPAAEVGTQTYLHSDATMLTEILVR
jgi:hypothetical protein